jgi:hypothetical protein
METETLKDTQLSPNRVMSELIIIRAELAPNYIKSLAVF